MTQPDGFKPEHWDALTRRWRNINIATFVLMFAASPVMGISAAHQVWPAFVASLTTWVISIAVNTYAFRHMLKCKRVAAAMRNRDQIERRFHPIALPDGELWESYNRAMQELNLAVGVDTAFDLSRAQRQAEETPELLRLRVQAQRQQMIDMTHEAMLYGFSVRLLHPVRCPICGAMSEETKNERCRGACHHEPVDSKTWTG